MGASRYEVLIVSAGTGPRTMRDWGAADLLKGVNWLKRMNAKGGDIFIRPMDGPELVLVETLNAAGLKDMKRQGLAYAVAIEAAPGQFQAWVKLSDQPLSERLRKPAVAGLARVFPMVSHFGRLAGFTNQQIEANRAELHPYVTVREATGMVAPAARPYLNAIETRLRELAAEKQRQVGANKASRVPRRDPSSSR